MLIEEAKKLELLRIWNTGEIAPGFGGRIIVHGFFFTCFNAAVMF